MFQHLLQTNLVKSEKEVKKLFTLFHLLWFLFNIERKLVIEAFSRQLICLYCAIMETLTVVLCVCITDRTLMILRLWIIILLLREDVCYNVTVQCEIWRGLVLLIIYVRYAFLLYPFQCNLIAIRMYFTRWLIRINSYDTRPCDIGLRVGLGDGFS